MQVHTLADRAMVLTLAISRWQGQRLDKEASREITEAKGAAADAARVNKHLVPKEILAPIVTAAGAVRDHFYTNTLPWRDNGGRLMTRKRYMAFIEVHERLVGEFNEAVRVFLTEKYPMAIERAAFRMGDMFDRSDYPSPAELRHRFRVTLDTEPVTSANDFRVQLGEEHMDRIRKSMDQAADQRIQAAQADIWKRMLERVSSVAERLGTADAVFRDSLFSNLDELVDLVPDLNVLEDPAIEEIRLQMKAKLGGLDPKDVRKDPAMRQELAGEAKAIVDRMAGFMRAFGADIAEAA